MSVTGLAGAVIARTSKPPPKVSALFEAAMNELGVVMPTTSVYTTSVNIAQVMPVRSRLRSGYAVEMRKHRRRATGRGRGPP